MSELRRIRLGELLDLTLHIVIHFGFEGMHDALALVMLPHLFVQFADDFILDLVTSCMYLSLERVQFFGVDLLVFFKLRAEVVKLHAEV